MQAPPPKYFWYSFTAMMVFGVVNVIFGYLNWKDRVDMQQTQRMTRTMLDSRARIQLILIDAAKAGRALTAEEIRIVDRLYVPAEYDTTDRK
jgi:hypothetical protein